MPDDTSSPFAGRGSSQDIESGLKLTPKFDTAGLLPAVASDAESGEVLMLAWMNAEALARTIETGEAHFFSRSRARLWRKGEESGNVMAVVELRTDCDQDAVWLRVRMGGAAKACHTGAWSCFYRRVPLGQEPGAQTRLEAAGPPQET